MSFYDLAFVGHMCWDEISLPGAPTTVAPGSAVLCGSIAAARSGARVAVVTKIAPKDRGMLESLESIGIDCFVVPALDTTWMRVIHESADPDARRLFQTKNAGWFDSEELPAVEADAFHLAGVTDREFNLDFIQSLRSRCRRLCADLQGFVRRVDLVSGAIRFAKHPDVRTVVSLLDSVKLDVVEAEVLTGTHDLREAATIIAAWGCREVMITQASGVQLRVDGVEFFELFTNRNQNGRTGRGDTTFGAYLARRISHSPAESLAYAAALVSIKMETPGPFAGTAQDVLLRMAEGNRTTTLAG